MAVSYCSGQWHKSAYVVTDDGIRFQISGTRADIDKVIERFGLKYQMFRESDFTCEIFSLDDRDTNNQAPGGSTNSVLE